MGHLINLLKSFVSPVTLIMLVSLLFVFSDANPFISKLVELQIPTNGRVLAFTTFLGFIVLYELLQRDKRSCDIGSSEIKEHIVSLQVVLEKANLISDVNAAFTEFQANERKFITGEYYIKEIMTLSDTRKRLGVNSYTQNKLEFLMTKIKHVHVP